VNDGKHSFDWPVIIRAVNTRNAMTATVEDGPFAPLYNEPTGAEKFNKFLVLLPTDSSAGSLFGQGLRFPFRTVCRISILPETAGMPSVYANNVKSVGIGEKACRQHSKVIELLISGVLIMLSGKLGNADTRRRPYEKGWKSQ
jgi:hypothetical protein